LTHPVAGYEVLAWTVLAFALRRVSDAQAPGLFLFAFGALRLFLEPLRAAPPLGEPGLEIGLVASLWMGVGLISVYLDQRLRGRCSL
jgi:prolipoprotein diacylglyceryltransferase